MQLRRKLQSLGAWHVDRVLAPVATGDDRMLSGSFPLIEVGGDRDGGGSASGSSSSRDQSAPLAAQASPPTAPRRSCVAAASPTVPASIWAGQLPGRRRGRPSAILSRPTRRSRSGKCALIEVLHYTPTRRDRLIPENSAPHRAARRIRHAERAAEAPCTFPSGKSLLTC